MKIKIQQWKIDKNYCIMHTKLLHNILYYRFIHSTIKQLIISRYNRLKGFYLRTFQKALSSLKLTLVAELTGLPKQYENIKNLNSMKSSAPDFQYPGTSLNRMGLILTIFQKGRYILK